MTTVLPSHTAPPIGTSLILSAFPSQPCVPTGIPTASGHTCVRSPLGASGLQPLSRRSAAPVLTVPSLTVFAAGFLGSSIFA
jgi:hypothetical protein